MAVKLLFQGIPQFEDSSGNPYSGARLFFYAAGSSTKQDTYSDSAGSTANSNPIELNSAGYPEVSGNIVAIWGTTGETYKIGLAAPGSDDPPASFIWTIDNVAPINDTSVSTDQWVGGPAPTYVSATSFTLVGDQTSTFHAGRRIKSTNSGGTVYSTIKSSAFGAVTTVTVVNDSGTLDAGLSAVSYGLLSATDPSTPLLSDAYPIVSGSSDKTKKVRLEVDGLTTDTTRVITVPDADGTLVTTTSPFPDTSAVVMGSVDNTKLVRIEADGLTAGTTRVITMPDADVNLGQVAPVTGTSQATTSGTEKDFSIPSWATQVTMSLSGVSTNGTSNVLFQLGDAGGIEPTTYLGAGSNTENSAAVTAANYTTGFGLPQGNAGNIVHGSITFTLVDAATFTWAASGVFAVSNAARTLQVAGSKALSAALTTVRLTTVNGTDAFDAGLVNVRYS